MKARLMNIIANTKIPIMCGEDTIGECTISQVAVEKLADSLIANGVCLSTFRVGDIVWVYDFMWGIIPCEVDEPYHCRCGTKDSCTFEMSFTEDDIGVYVFSTKEEAMTTWYVH